MTPLNIKTKLPSIALGYLLVTRTIVACVFVKVGLLVTSIGTIHGTKTYNGVTSPTSISAVIPGSILILLGVFLPIWSVLSYFAYSYVVGERSITINSGVLIRKSKSIDLSKIQNVTNVRGPVQALFGLSAIQIWTSSLDQVQFNSKGGVQSSPEGFLLLKRQEAEDLKNYLTTKGSVQQVQIVTPVTAQ